MRKKLLWLTFLIGLCVSMRSAPAPSPDTNVTASPTTPAAALPSPPPAPDAAELTRLLKEFLAGASRNDLAAHERFWADDLIYTGSIGRRLGKADILREVREEGPPKAGAESTIYSAEDIRIQQYDDTAVVAFRLIGTTKKGDKTEVANYLNSGTFLKRDGKWRVVNWQATKVPAKEEQGK
jgi:ketosteroid isomerase-like protein